MKSSMMALAVGAALAGCSTGGDGNVFAARDKTVEYYRVFDIKTDPGNQAVVKAASEGISKHVADATLATPGVAGQLTDQPGRFKLADSSGSMPPGAAPAGGPSCEGAVWTAKATPRVNGGDNMNMVACLFPYKNGYHLDMYAVFTEKEGGWLEWPRRFKGRLMGTPETWTDQTMVDVVRNIRDSTGAQVALVEAKPALAGTPWLEMAPNNAVPAGSGAAPGAGAAPAQTPAAPANGSTGGSGTASGVTSTAAPSAASGIAPIASTPAASSTEAASASTVATNGSDANGNKTDVK
ncbi:MAG: hypothetical protein ACXWC4_13315 [Telluria sp.]